MTFHRVPRIGLISRFCSYAQTCLFGLLISFHLDFLLLVPKKKKNNFVSSTLLLSTHHRALWSPIPFLYRLQCRCHQFSLIKLAIVTVRSHMSGSLRISSTTPVSRIRLCFAEYYYQVLSAKPEKHSSFFFSKKSTLCSDAYSFSS